MIVTSIIAIDLRDKYNNAILDAVQYDKNSRVVEATILEGGIPFRMPATGVTYEVRFKRGDGSPGNYSELSDGTKAVRLKGRSVLSIYINDLILSVPGIASISVCMKENGQEINTFSFYINVQKNVLPYGTEIKYPNTSDATATADQILKNRTAYAKGEKLTGTIESLATTTITPGTTAQTITKKYIDGTLTIKGDSNLKSENIKEGVKIFDVLGTLAASSGGTVEIGEGIEVESLSEAHYWTKTGKTGGSINETYNGNGTTIGYMNESVQYADEITLEGNNLVLVNPKSYTLTMDDDAAAEVLVGKYFSDASGFYRIPSDAGIIYYAPTQYTKGHLNATKVYKLSVTPGTEEQFSIVVSGDRNAYPDNGEKDGFTYVYQGVVGTELPELSNPGTASDLALDKQLIDADGNVVTGTLGEVTEGVLLNSTGGNETTMAGEAGDISFSVVGVYSKSNSGDNTMGVIVRPGARFAVRNVPTSLFGNATAADVAKGKTFTSAAGLLVEGTMEAASGQQLPDGAIVVKIVKGEQASTQVGSGDHLSVSYADDVEINDSIALAFVGTAKTLSNISATTDFSVLLGKYIRSSGSYGSTVGTIYYIPDDAIFTVGGQSTSKTLTCDKAQLVSLQKVII